MWLVLRGNKQTKNVSLERRWERGRRGRERGGGEKPGNIGVGGGGAKRVCVPSHNTILGC